ncbi:MAG: isocitrate lyase [Methanobacteriota archaeon]|nr:MAG: isocitrate lyase [Euryarchaeota archaeon]
MRSAKELDASWRQDERWAGIARPYRPEDIVRLRGSLGIEHTLARIGAERLWSLLRSDVPVTALGALTGNQAIQQVHAGLTAIYLSGWQVAADANDAGQMYPDQSLYPADSVPNVVRRVNNAFVREDEKQTAVGEPHVNGFAPIIADGEAGFGGPLNALELMKALIEAGAAAVHFEDQLASAKKCGHLGGKVLVSTGVFLQKLVAARLAADLCDVPTILIARTDANSAKLITTDVDPRDQPFIVDAERTTEGFHRFRGGIDASIARGVAYAPYADLLWCETSGPDLDEARTFADGVHARFPGKMLAYNCSSSFNWRKKLERKTIAAFQEELADMGYCFQFVTLAGFHALNLSMFQLARGYRGKGLTAYAELQDAESDAKADGYRAFEHQSFVGTAYFDEIAQVITGGDASTLAMAGSTEKEQFQEVGAKAEPVASSPPRLNASETG